MHLTCNTKLIELNTFQSKHAKGADVAGWGNIDKQKKERENIDDAKDLENIDDAKERENIDGADEWENKEDVDEWENIEDTDEWENKEDVDEWENKEDVDEWEDIDDTDEWGNIEDADEWENIEDREYWVQLMALCYGENECTATDVIVQFQENQENFKSIDYLQIRIVKLALVSFFL